MSEEKKMLKDYRFEDMKKPYPVDCDECEDEEMELKGSWVSKSGMTFSIYQCSNCKSIEVYMADVS